MVIGAISVAAAAAAVNGSTVLHSTANTARLGAASEKLAQSLHAKLTLVLATLFEAPFEI